MLIYIFVFSVAALVAVVLLATRKRQPLAFPQISVEAWNQLFESQREGAFRAALDQNGSESMVIGSILTTADPGSVRALLLSRPHSEGRSWIYRMLGRMMPAMDGILAMEGADWRKRHTIYVPLLTGANVKRYSLSIFQSSLEALADYCAHSKLVPANGTQQQQQRDRLCGYDLLSAVRHGAARFMLRFACGLDASRPDATALEADLDHYARTAFEVFPFAPSLLRKVTTYYKLWLLSYSIQARVTRIVEQKLYLNDTSNAAFEGETAGSPIAGNSSPPPTILSRMVEAGPSQFSLSAIASEVNHLHGAHKAVAFVTTCALTELSLPNPEAVKARRELIDEFERVCGRPMLVLALDGSGRIDVAATMAQAARAHAAFEGRGDSLCVPPSSLPGGWRPPCRSDLEQGRLPVLSRIWRETLRRHVVSMGVLRRTAKASGRDNEGALSSSSASRQRKGSDADETSVGSSGSSRAAVDPAIVGGVPLPPGTDVMILLHALHHNPALWGDDASAWRPDRWIAIDASRKGGSAAAKLQQQADTEALLPDPLKPLPFYPFLEGVRRCAGVHLAELEAAVMLYVWLMIADVRVTASTIADATSSGSEVVAAAEATANAYGSEPLARAGDTTRHRVAIEAVDCGYDNGSGASRHRYKLRKRPDMFSSLDGRLPFTIAKPQQ